MATDSYSLAIVKAKKKERSVSERFAWLRRGMVRQLLDARGMNLLRLYEEYCREHGKEAVHRSVFYRVVKGPTRSEATERWIAEYLGLKREDLWA